MSGRRYGRFTSISGDLPCPYPPACVGSLPARSPSVLPPAHRRRAARAQDPRFQPAAASDVYAQTSWDLARWTRPGGALRQIPHPSQTSRPVTISFIHDQGAPVVSGFGGCNQYNAPYTVANGLLIVRSRPVSTMMACNPEAMRLEQDFLDGLTRITSSTLDNTGNPRRLTLLLSSGDTLDFGRRIDPATGGQMGPKSSCTSIPSGCPAMPAPAAPCATRCATARPSPGSSGMAISPASLPAGRALSAARGRSARSESAGRCVRLEMGAGRGGRAGAGAALRPGPGAARQRL